MFDTEAFVDITSPITEGEETSISRPALSRCLHNVLLTTPPWRFPQGHHRRAASRFSKISPRQTNSLLQCNSGQMMETARRQIVRAMKIRGVFREFECWKYAPRGAPHTLPCLSYRVGRVRLRPLLWRSRSRALLDLKIAFRGFAQDRRSAHQASGRSPNNHVRRGTTRRATARRAFSSASARRLLRWR